MKRSTKIALIVAAALFAVGAVLCAIAFGGVGFSWYGLSTADKGDYVTQTEQFAAADFSKVQLDIEVDDVRVGPSPDGQIHIKYVDSKNLHYTLSTANATLKLEQVVKNTFWSGQWFGFDLGVPDSDVQLLLPEDYDGDLTIENDVGDVDLRDVTISGAMDCQMDTGSFDAQQLRAGSVMAGSDVGGVGGDGWTVNRYVSLSTDTGDIVLKNAEIGGDLLCHSDVGGSHLVRVTAKTAEMTAETGDINFERLAVDRLTVETDVGDVDGSIDGVQTDYTIFTDADIGDSDLQDQKGTTDKEISITTDTGDIRIAFLR